MKVDKATLGTISHKLAAAIDLALNEGLHREKVDPTRVNRLRISGWPFCQIKWFLGLPRSTSKANFISSGMKYFTNVGHVLHGVVQNALTNVGIEAFGITLIGDWKCSKCGQLHTIQKKPEQCSCGNDSFLFEEIAIERGLITGHIDTVLSFKMKSTGQEMWVVIDYKTTSLKKVNAKDRKIPYKENIFQIGGYVGQLHEMGYPVIPLAFLIYVPRDNPWRYCVEPALLDFDEEARRAKLYKKRFIKIASLDSLEELERTVANRPCKDKLLADFAHCKYADMCAGPDQHKFILREAIAAFHKVEAKLPIRKKTDEVPDC